MTASWMGVAQAEVLEYQICMRARGPGEAANPCRDPRVEYGVWPAVSALVLFWAAVFLVYWCIPAWRVRRRRLHRLGGDLLPELVAHVRGLQQEVSVGTRITYLLAPLDSRVAGLAFGRVGRRYIVISGGLAALFVRDPRAFRTVLLHELAHFRNRDVDIAFLVVVTWRVSLFLLIYRLLANSVNIALGRFPDFGVLSEIAATAAAAGLAVLVPLTRNAVLRSRELYADARTTLWSNEHAEFQRLFDEYSRGPTGRSAPLMRVHPPMEERREALTDASNLFAFGFWDALGTGAVVALSHVGLAVFLAHPTGSPVDQVSSRVAIVCAGTLLAACVVISAWRVSLRRFVRRERVDVNGAGVGIAIGIGVASLASPTLANLVSRVPVASASAVLVLWWPIVLLSGWLIVRWCASLTASWVRVAAGRRRPALVVVGVSVLAATPMTIWLHLVLQLRDLAVVGEWIGTFDSVIATFLFAVLVDVIVNAVPALVFVLSLVLLPLAGRTWANRRDRRRRPGTSVVSENRAL
ncbi:M48 family metalloprotease [Pseudonocardia sp. DLS-67]